MNEGQELGLKEIDLLDLIFYCLRKWRFIATFMIFMAIITGGFKYHTIMKENQPVQEEQISAGEEEPYETIIRERERDVRQKKDYLDHSIVMQINPYCVSEGSLSYYIECEGDKENLATAYIAYILGGEMLEDLNEEDGDVPVEDLQYLISCIKSSNSKVKDSVLSDNGEIQNDSAVFVIQIKMPTGDLCETYIKRIEKLMVDYSSRLRSEMKEHKLTLLASAQLEVTDLDIQNYQSNMLNDYMTVINSLQAMPTEHQKTPDVQKEKDISMADVLPSVLRYFVLGLILGACLACLVLSILYFFGGRLQNIEFFQPQFDMPLIGVVRTSGRKKTLFSFIDSLIFKLRGGLHAKISFEEQKKIAIVNLQAIISRNFRDEGAKKIMLAGTINDRDIVELCDCFCTEINGVSLSTYMQIIFQSSALKELENYDAVLFLEKQDQSYSELIAYERKLALDRGVKVLGTIVLC